MKTKKRGCRVLTLVVVLSMLLMSLSACGGESGSETEDAITIKIPHIYGDGHPMTVALDEFFKTEIEARSNGRLIVETFPNSTLATDEQIYEGLRNGTYEMGVTSIVFQDAVPLAAAFQLPFLFKDFAQAKAALKDQDYGFQLLEGIDNLGFSVLDIAPDGFRIMTLNRKIEDISDFKGFKLRTANYENMIRMGELLGCAVTPMAMTEVFSALEQKVIDGQENPPSTIKAAGWYEIQDYMMLTNHVFTPLFVMVNNDFYDSLDTDLQQVLTETSAELANLVWEKAETAAQQDIDAMKESGIEVYSPTDTFRRQMVEATAPMYTDIYQKFDGAEDIIKNMQSL